MMETLAVVVTIAASVGAVLTTLNSFLGLLSLTRGNKRDSKIQEVMISIDGRWAETLEVIEAQKRQIATLTTRVEEALVKSAKAEGALEVAKISIPRTEGPLEVALVSIPDAEKTDVVK